MDNKRTIGCILMAAGISDRFENGNKLLADLDGRPVIRYVIETLLTVKSLFDREDSDISLDLLTVTRWQEIHDLCTEAGMPCVLYEGGLQSDTIRAGLTGAEDANWEGCMFLAGDQPLIKADTIKRLAEAFAAEPGRPCRASWQGNPSSPVIFPAACFDALRKLKGDEGGRQLLRGSEKPAALVEAGDLSELMDIDTFQDYQQMIRRVFKG